MFDTGSYAHESELELGAQKKVFCNVCRINTAHELKGVHVCEHDEVEYEIDEEDIYPKSCTSE